MAVIPTYGGQTGSSAAMNRIKASKARQRSRIKKPKPVSGIDAIKAVIEQSTGAKLPKEKAPTQPYGGQYGSTAGMDAYNRNNPASPDNINGADSDPYGLGAMQAALQAQLTGGNGGVSNKELAKLLSQSVNGTYDPQIQALQQAMSGAKKRAGSARKDLKALYDDLSSYYTGRIPATQKMYGIADKDAANRTASLKNSITSDYTNRLKEQVDMYKQLGIEAAVPSATQGQYADEAGQLAIADNTGNAEEAALNQEERGDLTYWNEGAGIAQTEGAEQQSALIQQLNDYLNTQGTSIATLKGQKSAAYSQGLLEAKQKAADAATQRQNEIWQHMLDLARLKQSAAKASSGGSGSTPSKGLTGVAAYLGSQRLADEFQTSLQQAITWNQTPQAKQYYGGQVPNSPEEMAQVIRDNAANRGLSVDDQLKLWQAALVYYNKYK